MDGQQLDIRTHCQNDKCLAALRFSFKRFGRLPLTCPKCKIKQAFLIEEDNQPGSPGYKVIGLGLIIPGQPMPEPQPAPRPVQQPAPQQQPIPQPIPQPAPQPAPQQVAKFDQEIPVGKEMMLGCPHCGTSLKIKITKEGNGRMQCGKCKGFIDFKAVSKTVVQFAAKPTTTKRGRLVKVNGFLKRNEIFKLRDGKNVIGRFDHQSQSDIAISGDNFMSRRSVEIEVKTVMGGYSYVFTILKSANPIVYNKKEYRAPYSRELKFGDTFVLGETTFRFEADD